MKVLEGGRTEPVCSTPLGEEASIVFLSLVEHRRYVFTFSDERNRVGRRKDGG